MARASGIEGEKKYETSFLPQFISSVEKISWSEKDREYDRVVRKPRQITIEVSRAKFRPETMNVAMKKSRVDRHTPECTDATKEIRCD